MSNGHGQTTQLTMGDLQQFERVALAHMPSAYNLAYWIVRNRADAEDVVQDAYLRAFRAFATCTSEDVRPWLLTIVRNVAYRWLSVRSRTANVVSIEDALSSRHDGPELATDQPTAEDLLIARGDQAMVRRALGELPSAFREAVVLRELEGLSYQEIARVMDIPVGTVMSRLARARDQLRERLARLMAEENKDAL